MALPISVEGGSVTSIRPRRLLLIGALTLAVGVADAQGPSPEVMARVKAVMAAFNGGDAQVDVLIAEHFTEDARTEPDIEARRQWFARQRKQFGTIQPGAGLQRRSRETVVAQAISSTSGRINIILTLEPATSLLRALDVERAADPGPPPPPISGSMPDAELSTTLHGYLEKLASGGALSGAVLIARDGVPIFSRAYGFAHVGNAVPNAVDTRFNIGSINKHFTKALLAQLVADGKIAMTDTLGKHLPDYPNTDAAAGVTLQQLLDHTAGLPDWFNTPAWASAPKADLRANADFVPLFASKPLKWRPGSQTEYCNSCYVVLGAIIEQIEGTPYEDVVARRLFGPAAMTGAGFFAQDDPLPKVAVGYTRRLAPFVTSPLRSNVLMLGARGNAAGGAYASVQDLLAWDNALREGRVLNKTAAAWFFGVPSVPDQRLRAAIGIAGGTAGVNASLESDGRWTVVVLTNLDPPTGENLGASLFRQLRQ